jgi:KDO2-lipid IV(A) lauroyltransferase
MSKKISGVSELCLSQFFQHPFNVILAKALPFICLRAYLYLIGLVYFGFKHGDGKTITKCLTYMLHLRPSALSYYMNIMGTFRGLFDHYYEKLIMAHRPLPEMKEFLNRHLKITNQRHLDKIADSGKGGILVTGHFGAVEFLPLSLAIKGYKIAMICRFKTEKLRGALMSKARQMDVELIDADQPKVAFRAFQAIKNGRILVTECDEFSEWRPDQDKSVRVFGHRVPRDKTLDFFHRRARVPALMGLIRREKGGFTLSIDALADGPSDVSLAAAAWQKLESYILTYPQQWYQWKDAAVELAGYIRWDKQHAIDQAHRIQPKYPVLSADLS